MNASSRSRPRAGRLALLPGILVFGLPWSACEKSPPPPPSWPPGTVLVMNDEPIQPEEVDEIAGWFALLEPQDTPLQLRRLALTNFIFPRIAARGVDPMRRREMRDLAEACRRDAVAGTMPPGPLPGPMECEGTGAFVELGLLIWKAALDAEPGQWTPVLEDVGSYHFFRVKKREEGPLPSLMRFTIGTFDFPYLDPATGHAAVEVALDRSNLIILDENWREAVPAAWQYRLHARNP